jgi:hypothetical protein
MSQARAQARAPALTDQQRIAQLAFSHSYPRQQLLFVGLRHLKPSFCLSTRSLRFHQFCLSPVHSSPRLFCSALGGTRSPLRRQPSKPLFANSHIR